MPDDGSTFKTLHSDVVWVESTLRLERDEWRFEEVSGVAWWAGLPRDAAMEVVPSDRVVPLSVLAPADAGPWVLVNGGFYEQGPMGLVVTGGCELNPLTTRGGSGVIAGGPDRVAVMHREAWDGQSQEALQSIDRLVDGGRSLVRQRPEAPGAARSAVVISEDLIWVVVAAATDSVEGHDEYLRLVRTTGNGLSLWAFADYLVASRGAHQALNLDGGISSQLMVRTGEHRFEVKGEKGTINALVLRPP
jgi:hypothetical protein